MANVIKKSAKTGRPHKSTAAPGVFQRSGVFWLRYSVGGDQIRVSLGTSDPEEAVKRANDRRGLKVASKKTGRILGGKTQIDRDLEKYQAAKLAAKKFTSGSAKAAAQAVKDFAKVMRITDPVMITTASLEEYYRKIKLPSEGENGPAPKSEATAQTYTTRVGTFARWCGLRVETPEFPEAPSRDVALSKEKVEELLGKAEGDVKFVLMCGFLAGMRRGEISWARPSWFDFTRRKINIPNPDLVTGWRPKSRRKRSIPLVPEFAAFIKKEFPDWSDRSFCLRPKVKPGKAIYRFDTRKLFAAFAALHCPELTTHVMRHTFTTILANNPKISIAKLSEFTGDRIATLERHYIHLDSNADEAAESFKVEPKPEDDPMISIPAKFMKSLRLVHQPLG